MRATVTPVLLAMAVAVSLGGPDVSMAALVGAGQASAGRVVAERQQGGATRWLSNLTDAARQFRGQAKAIISVRFEYQHLVTDAGIFLGINQNDRPAHPSLPVRLQLIDLPPPACA